MTPRDSVADRYYAAFNARDLDAWVETLDEDVEVLIDAGVLRGRLVARSYLAGIMQAYPGVTVADRRIVAASPDAVVSEFHLINPTAALVPDPSGRDRKGVPWRLDGVTCEVLRLRGDRITSLHSYYSPRPTDRTPVAEVPSRAEAARIAHRHAALGRVATHVAGGASEQDLVFMMNQVIAEFAGVDVCLMMRFDTDDTAVLLAASGLVDAAALLGRRFELSEDILAVRNSGRALRFGARGWPALQPVGEPETTSSLHWCVGVPIILRGTVWGVSLLGSARAEPFADDTESGITAFTELASTALTNAQANDELAERAREQSELRQVAEIAAAGADPAEVFSAVTRSASALLDGLPTMLQRFVDHESADLLAVHGFAADVPRAGKRVTVDPDGVTAEVQRTGRPARIDDYLKEPANRLAMQVGLRASVGVPVAVGGRPWGVLVASSMQTALPPAAERRLSLIAETGAAAIAGAHARGELRALADEQAALRRVAELVARGVGQDEIFDALTAEATGLIEEPTTLIRFDDAHNCTVVGTSGGPAAVGSLVNTEEGSLVALIQRTRRPARIDDGERPGRIDGGGRRHDYGGSSEVGVPIIVGVRLWGMLSATSSGRRLATATEHRLRQFVGILAVAVVNGEARQKLTDLADEQAALRRVAELAAHNAPAEQVLQAVASEAAALAGVEFTTLLRYEQDGSTQIVALDGAPDGVVLGMRAPGTGDGAVQRVWRTRQPARIDDLATMSGVWPQLAHRYGFTASAAVPIVIRGDLWGALVAVGRGEAFPRPIEEHLANFAELAGTAVSAADARQELRLLAEEQAALRRVAELVARGANLDEVFMAAATEASTLLGRLAAALMRFDGDTAVVVAVCNSPVPLGMGVPIDDGNDLGILRRTGRPTRTDSFAGTSLADIAIALGVGAGVAVPVTVEGRVWGALTASTPDSPLPAGSEERLTPFAELVAAAIGNAENKAKLTASRARVVATADETRRRLQRDVHDGAQQRLVHTIIALKLAQQALPPEDPASALLLQGLNNAERANSELRDVVRGILPSSLTHGGLRSGLETLVADLALPVDLTVLAPRLPAHIETTAYFVVAEAMTNVVKHAHANRATVDVAVDDQTLVIDIRDDGVGGADPTGGTGLTGLFDRVEASDGTLTVTSSDGAGTAIHATIPVRERMTANNFGDVSVRP